MLILFVLVLPLEFHFQDLYCINYLFNNKKLLNYVSSNGQPSLASTELNAARLLHHKYFSIFFA